MKVVITTNSLRQPLTGLGNYTFNLIQALHRVNGNQFNFFDGTEWTSSCSIKPQKISHKLLNILRKLPFAYQAKRFVGQESFRRGVGKFKPDIYHEPNFLAYKSRLPTVITVHDLSWIKFPKVHPPSRVREMNRFFERGIKHASHIITDAEYIRDEFIAHFNYPADRVTAIPLGVRTSFTLYSPEETKATIDPLGLTHGTYILAVGTLEPRKNLNVAIDAFLLLPPKLRQNYPLVIAGSKGWLLEGLEKKLNPFIQSGEIKFLGYLPQEQLPHLMAGATTLVFPSIYEGFGLPPLEAMASGVPVIAANNSSIPEVVGDAGILLGAYDVHGFANAMRSFIEDPALRTLYCQKALEQSQRFTWDQCALRTLAVYQHVLATH